MKKTSKKEIRNYQWIMECVNRDLVKHINSKFFENAVRRIIKETGKELRDMSDEEKELWAKYYDEQVDALRETIDYQWLIEEVEKRFEISINHLPAFEYAFGDIFGLLIERDKEYLLEDITLLGDKEFNRLFKLYVNEVNRWERYRKSLKE